MSLTLSRAGLRRGLHHPHVVCDGCCHRVNPGMSFHLPVSASSCAGTGRLRGPCVSYSGTSRLLHARGFEDGDERARTRFNIRAYAAPPFCAFPPLCRGRLFGGRTPHKSTARHRANIFSAYFSSLPSSREGTWEDLCNRNGIKIAAAMVGRRRYARTDFLVPLAFHSSPPRLALFAHGERARRVAAQACGGRRSLRCRGALELGLPRTLFISHLLFTFSSSSLSLLSDQNTYVAVLLILTTWAVCAGALDDNLCYVVRLLPSAVLRLGVIMLFFALFIVLLNMPFLCITPPAPLCILPQGCRLLCVCFLLSCLRQYLRNAFPHSICCCSRGISLCCSLAACSSFYITRYHRHAGIGFLLFRHGV